MKYTMSTTAHEINHTVIKTTSPTCFAALALDASKKLETENKWKYEQLHLGYFVVLFLTRTKEADQARKKLKIQSRGRVKTGQTVRFAKL